VCATFRPTKKTFLFKPCYTLFLVLVVFLLQWLPVLTHLGTSALQTTQTLPAFSDIQSMSQNDLTHSVAAAAITQVKLCLYDNEEPHIWFRLSEAQFPAAGIKSQKLKCANALASLPKQVLRDILDTLDICKESDDPFDCLKNSERIFFHIFTMMLTLLGLPPVALFHLGFCGSGCSMTSLPGCEPAWAASRAC
jgi:hypothetical protein